MCLGMGHLQATHVSRDCVKNTYLFYWWNFDFGLLGFLPPRLLHLLPSPFPSPSTRPFTYFFRFDACLDCQSLLILKPTSQIGRVPLHLILFDRQYRQASWTLVVPSVSELRLGLLRALRMHTSRLYSLVISSFIFVRLVVLVY